MKKLIIILVALALVAAIAIYFVVKNLNKEDETETVAVTQAKAQDKKPSSQSVFYSEEQQVKKADKADRLRQGHQENVAKKDKRSKLFGKG